MNGETASERPELTTVPTPRRPLLVIHSGTFHLDDALAYAVLRVALGLGAAPARARGAPAMSQKAIEIGSEPREAPRR